MSTARRPNRYRVTAFLDDLTGPRGERVTIASDLARAIDAREVARNTSRLPFVTFTTVEGPASKWLTLRVFAGGNAYASRGEAIRGEEARQRQAGAARAPAQADPLAGARAAHRAAHGIPRPRPLHRDPVTGKPVV
jgi:hypothetical protein